VGVVGEAIDSIRIDIDFMIYFITIPFQAP
jgi:hypothetical protein